jgi:hypothetical protein
MISAFLFKKHFSLFQPRHGWGGGLELVKIGISLLIFGNKKKNYIKNLNLNFFFKPLINAA